jgi:pimeloyl-ACP methyl ester carboxylesterase
METFEVGGLRIAYRRAGSGPVLVLAHGAMGDSRDWRRQLEGLSDELTVVPWVAPGCGASDDLGLSFGGGLALELYRRHPGLPRSLVLASACWTSGRPGCGR